MQLSIEENVGHNHKVSAKYRMHRNSQPGQGGPLSLMPCNAYLRTRAEPPGRGSNLSNDDEGIRLEYNRFAQT